MLSGGAGAKIPNDYEDLWGAEGLLSVVLGEADNIRIEEPGVFDAEFYTEKDDKRLYWQAKIHEERGNWSLYSIKHVLASFGKRIAEGHCVRFVSTTDAKDLRELARDCRSALDWQEFQQRFLLPVQIRRSRFTQVMRCWDLQDEELTFHRLRMLETRVKDEDSLRDDLLLKLQFRFDAPPNSTLATLKDLYRTSVHKLLNANDVRSALESVGIRELVITATDHDREQLLAVTTQYCEAQKQILIRETLTPRKEIADLKQKLQAKENVQDVFLVGEAGSGKSGAVLELIQYLKDETIPVLAFRMDMLPPSLSTPRALGQHWSLTDSPIRILTQLHPRRCIAVVIDQLDAVSTASGRLSPLAGLLDGLLNEIDGARASSNEILLLLVCREFDIDNDAQLRRLRSRKHITQKIGKLSKDEVLAIVRPLRAGQSLTDKQIETLRLPQNLSLYVQILDGAEDGLAFTSQQDLFDRYWVIKRKAVLAKSGLAMDHWHEAIDGFVGYANSRQTLSVPVEHLDSLPPQYLEALLSEGVMLKDEQRIRFRHESFFDYSYCRRLYTKGIDVVAEWENDEQHLFRRSQVRQWLTYVRAREASAYLNCVQRILASQTIRPHIKTHVLQVVMAVEDPFRDEWVLLKPLIEAGLKTPKVEQSSEGWLASRAWETFSNSNTWFPLFVENGECVSWFKTGDSLVADDLSFYLRFQARSNPTVVSSVLLGLMDSPMLTNQRLLNILAFSNLHKSRSLFELTLRFISDGRLDDMGDHVLDNDLAKAEPAWYAELAAQSLKRWATIIEAHHGDGPMPYIKLCSALQGEDIIAAAKAAPDTYLELVLPEVIRLAELSRFEQEGPLRFSWIWAHRWDDDFPSSTEAYVIGCEEALATIAATDPIHADQYANSLATMPYTVSNEMLLRLFAAAPEHFGDRGCRFLIENPGRIEQGFFNQHMWWGRQVILKCSPHCSDEVFQELERAMLNYRHHKHKRYWDEVYELSSALDPNRLSNSGRRQVADLEKRFPHKRFERKKGITIGTYTPIPETAYAHMTDQQWLSAMQKHNDPHFHDWDRPGMGGPWELAQGMESRVKEEPERFARLFHELPENVDSSYPRHILSGLKDSTAANDLRLSIALDGLSKEGCIMAALGLIKAVAMEELLDHEVVERLCNVALTDPSPESERWKDDERQGEGMFSQGINSARGEAMRTLAEILHKDGRHKDRIVALLEESKSDPSLAVRSCGMAIVRNLTGYDIPIALKFFLDFAAIDIRIVDSQHARVFFDWALWKHLSELEWIISEAHKKENISLHKFAGRASAIASLTNPDRQDLVARALQGPVASRKGVLEVAKANLASEEHRLLCVNWLLTLFQDADESLRKDAAHCFWQLWHKHDGSIKGTEDFIRGFVASPAFVTDPSTLLHALDDNALEMTDLVIDVCEAYLSAVDRGNDGGRFRVDDHSVSKLIFRTYQHLPDGPDRMRALDLIDRMCVAGVSTSAELLAEFDR